MDIKLVWIYILSLKLVRPVFVYTADSDKLCAKE